MQNKLEIALGVVIWDVIQEHIDNVPETQDLDDLTREKLIGDSVNNMALILSENLREECKDMIDDIKRENYWGSYTLSDEDRKWSYQEAQLDGLKYLKLQAQHLNKSKLNKEK